MAVLRVDNHTFLKMSTKTFTIILFILSALLCLPEEAKAQKWSVSTNLVDYVNLGTINAEADLAVARHWTIGLQARYNNWNFNRQAPEHQVQNRKQSYAIVTRLYPWHIYSGWFFTGRLQYQEYNRTNCLWGKPRSATEEGDSFGAGLGFGYDYMIHRNINLEFGASFWGGYKVYTKYDCPTCGTITESCSRGFILPDNVFISLQFIF